MSKDKGIYQNQPQKMITFHIGLSHSQILKNLKRCHQKSRSSNDNFSESVDVSDRESSDFSWKHIRILYTELTKQKCSGHLTHFMEFIPSLLCTLTRTKQLSTTHLPILGPNKPHRLRPYSFGEEKKWKISIMSTLEDSCFESLMQQYKSNMNLVSTFVSKESLSWSLGFHVFHWIVDIQKTPGHCYPSCPENPPRLCPIRLLRMSKGSSFPANLV